MSAKSLADNALNMPYCGKMSHFVCDVAIREV